MSKLIDDIIENLKKIDNNHRVVREQTIAAVVAVMLIHFDYKDVMSFTGKVLDKYDKNVKMAIGDIIASGDFEKLKLLKDVDKINVAMDKMAKSVARDLLDIDESIF